MAISCAGARRTPSSTRGTRGCGNVSPASREALGERWLDLYLTSPAWRFVCAAGACGPAPVIGLMVPSVDRVGRYFPLTLVANLPPEVSPMAAVRASSAFFDQAERLIIDTLATEDIDFERFDEQVMELGAALESILPPRVVLDPAAAAMLEDGSGLWQIPIGVDGRSRRRVRAAVVAAVVVAV